eukprot:UN20713
MTPNILHLKIMFYIEKTVSKKIWRSKKSFPSNVKPLSDRPPPISVAEKTSKSAKILPIGFLAKNRKSFIMLRKRFFRNFRKKNVPMGILTKFSKNLPVV